MKPWEVVFGCLWLLLYGTYLLFIRLLVPELIYLTAEYLMQ